MRYHKRYYLTVAGIVNHVELRKIISFWFWDKIMLMMK